MPKEIIHDPRESGWRVANSEWNQHPFEQPMFGLEGCFPHILLCNLDLVITTVKIQFGEINNIL